MQALETIRQGIALPRVALALEDALHSEMGGIGSIHDLAPLHALGDSCTLARILVFIVTDSCLVGRITSVEPAFWSNASRKGTLLQCHGSIFAPRASQILFLDRWLG